MVIRLRSSDVTSQHLGLELLLSQVSELCDSHPPALSCSPTGPAVLDYYKGTLSAIVFLYLPQVGSEDLKPTDC